MKVVQVVPANGLFEIFECHKVITNITVSAWLIGSSHPSPRISAIYILWYMQGQDR